MHQITYICTKCNEMESTKRILLRLSSEIDHELDKFSSGDIVNKENAPIIHANLDLMAQTSKNIKKLTDNYKKSEKYN